MKGANIFGSFHENLKCTREYHNRFPNVTFEQNSTTDSDLNVPFSGEEIFGKYLDLHPFFLRYCNIPKIQSGTDIDYLHFLDKFNSFFHISEANKDTKAYSDYVYDLWVYLIDFFSRVQQLVDLSDSLKDWELDFNKK
jgi:splicing factor 3A subunit 3